MEASVSGRFDFGWLSPLPFRARRKKQLEDEQQEGSGKREAGEAAGAPFLDHAGPSLVAIASNLIAVQAQNSLAEWEEMSRNGMPL